MDWHIVLVNSLSMSAAVILMTVVVTYDIYAMHVAECRFTSTEGVSGTDRVLQNMIVR